MAYPQEDTAPVSKIKGPLEFSSSQIKFALFGYKDRKRTIFAKTSDTPFELLGYYPIELTKSSGSSLGFFWQLLDLFEKPIQSIMSLPFRREADTQDVERLVLLWQGLASKGDKLVIKEVFDRNAIDIAEAATVEDHWRSAISISPVIAECRRADIRNMRIRVSLWGCIAVLAVLIVLGVSITRPC